jgi:hypothetical protein
LRDELRIAQLFKRRNHHTTFATTMRGFSDHRRVEVLYYFRHLKFSRSRLLQRCPQQQIGLPVYCYSPLFRQLL